MRWLEIAWAEVGVQETSGPAATPAILGYFRAAGRPDVTSDEVAWCAAFAGACLERAGIAQTIPPAEALLARSFLGVGQAIAEPRMGAIAVLSRGSDPRAGHVGFVVGWTEADLVLLGGNQANRVSTQHFPRSRLLPGGLRWPGPVVAARDLKDSRIAAKATRQTRDGARVVGVEMVPDAAVTAAGDALAPPAGSFPSPDTLVSGAGWLQSTIETTASFGAFAAHRWPWIAGALALYWLARMAWDAFGIGRARAEDASVGKTA